MATRIAKRNHHYHRHHQLRRTHRRSVVVFEYGGVIEVKESDKYKSQLVAQYRSTDYHSKRPNHSESSRRGPQSSRNTANRRHFAETSNFAPHYWTGRCWWRW